AVGGLADHLDAFGHVEVPAEPLPHQRMVVRDGNPDRHGTSGRRARHILPRATLPVQKATGQNRYRQLTKSSAEIPHPAARTEVTSASGIFRPSPTPERPHNAGKTTTANRGTDRSGLSANGSTSGSRRLSAP